MDKHRAHQIAAGESLPLLGSPAAKDRAQRAKRSPPQTIANGKRGGIKLHLHAQYTIGGLPESRGVCIRMRNLLAREPAGVFPLCPGPAPERRTRKSSLLFWRKPLETMGILGLIPVAGAIPSPVFLISEQEYRLDFPGGIYYNILYTLQLSSNKTRRQSQNAETHSSGR